MYKVGILIYDNVEVLDFAGPFEVLSTSVNVETNLKCFEVSLIAKSHDVITAFNGLRVLPDYDITTDPEFDILIIPGGYEHDVVSDHAVIDYIQAQQSKSQLIASVCTGAFILARAGLLEGKSVTTHWADVSRLKDEYPHLNVLSNVRYLDQTTIMTSAGISAGIDMSLHIVEKFYSKKTALKTAKRMEYDWNKNEDI
jgi:transcriptional regulator GlxA family with amidase domain